jgi:hypothetical protein
MPYGKDFLDTLDKILFESHNHATSKRVMHECTKCHNKTPQEVSAIGNLEGTCNACQEAKLILFDGTVFGQNNEIY